MDAYIKEIKKKIRASNDQTEIEQLRSELKAHVATFTEEEFAIYRKESIASIERTMAEMDKLLEAYELMKNNILQYS